ncbi:MFS transporter [Vogesella sp. LIG4]|uniref:AmpG family muropeptide MFS transporter n=1 Tax=Vogesella sp. LIG4 TaxID=1192162 RepID=UPI00081FCF23|nr:MFS transporter [Vogesella sp. LIG4]SCK15287.1 MFS transporter, PAT family, beta-lactamase induction signal transducer AmpG [Vogesella sp. LIG4]
MRDIRQLGSWRMLMIWVLGFASGLPLALSGTAMQAWLTVDGIDVATIGFLSLVGLPYTFKFLWAPLMDRFEPPLFGRRRGWLVLTQLGLAAALLAMSALSPARDVQGFALLAVLLAFLSASQDVVIDAYRTDVVTPEQRGLASSLGVFGYRLAMVLSGGIAMVWADPLNGGGWSWNGIYRLMALIMLLLAGLSLLLLPPVPKDSVAPQSDARNDLKGFAALLLVVVIGYQFTTHLVAPLADRVLSPLFPLAVSQPHSASQGAVQAVAQTVPPAANPASTATGNKMQAGKAAAARPAVAPKKKWVDLLSLLIGVAFTVPLAWWAARRAKFETLNRSLGNFFSMEAAGSFLALIILYKLGDAFAGALTTTFLLKGVGFAQAEIGVVNKVIGIWLTIVGALLGGTLMLRLGLYRALLGFGVFQMFSNLGFWLVAVSGKGAWGGFTLPAFDWIIVALKESTQVDYLLLFAVALENLASGMGTAAFVAFLMALCNHRFTATQFALLSAFAAIGRVWVGPLSGVLTESIGWPAFFLFATASAAPGLIMLMRLKTRVMALDIARA